MSMSIQKRAKIFDSDRKNMKRTLLKCEHLSKLYLSTESKNKYDSLMCTIVNYVRDITSADSEKALNTLNHSTRLTLLI